MSVVAIFMTLVVIGFLLYIVQLLPMDATVKRILQAAVIIVVGLWVLRELGVLAALDKVKVEGPPFPALRSPGRPPLPAARLG